MILDGELVLDHDYRTNTYKHRFLIFDCVLANYRLIHQWNYKERLNKAIIFTNFIKDNIKIF